MTAVVGVDVGTSGVKASLVEVKGESVVELRSTSVPYLAANEPCRDPDRWVAASYEALDALELPGPVEGAGFSGQMHALVALDGDGKPVHDALLWLDYEGAPVLEKFISDHPEIDLLRRTGNVPLPDFTLAKWLMLQDRSPGVAGRAAHLVLAKDYVRGVLCADRWLTDWNEASGTQVFDPWRRDWAADVAAAASLPIALLPQVTEATTEVGVLRNRSGAVLSARCVVGTGDQASAARAVGVSRAGVVSLGLGTSGVVAGEIEAGMVGNNWDGGFHLFSLDASEAFQVIGTVPSVGPTLRWVAQLLRVPVAKLGDLASASESGPGGVAFLPYLGGRGAPHADSAQSGGLVGLRETTTDAEIAQAVFVGIALELAAVIEELGQAGAKVCEVVCSGGASRDRHLLATIAAALEVPCRSASAADASSVGAALLGLDAIDATGLPRLAGGLVAPAGTPLYADAWREARASLISELSAR